MANANRPTTQTDFRRLPKAKRGGRTPEAAYQIHQQRHRAHKLDSVNRPTLVQFLLGKRMVAPASIGRFALPSDHLPTLGKQHARKQRWCDPRATIQRTHVHTESGEYSGRTRYTKHDYTHRVECWGMVIGRYLYYRIDTDSGLKSGTMKAPRGWQWAIDSLDVHLTNGSGADYHPTADDLLSGMKPRDLAAIARQNKQRRDEVAKDAKSFAKLRQRMLPSVTVSMQDSRRAGNCVSGTLSFIHRLGIRHQRSNPYQQVPAKLLARANDPLADLAINAAIQRATLVSI